MKQPQDNQADLSEVKRLLVEALERRRRNCAPDDEAGVRRIPALVIARRFAALHPFASRSRTNRDSLKRATRLIVINLRREGVPVLADAAGYYLPLSASDHSTYQTWRRGRGLSHLAAASADARSAAVQDAVGQLGLFAELQARPKRPSNSA